MKPDIETEIADWETDFRERNGRIPSYQNRERWFMERIETLRRTTAQRCMAIADEVHSERRARWNESRSHSYEYDRSVGAHLVSERIRKEFELEAGKKV